jgi:plasmid replication initiation protein
VNIEYQKDGEVRKHNSLIKTGDMSATQRKCFNLILEHSIKIMLEFGKVDSFSMSLKDFKENVLDYDTNNNQWFGLEMEKLMSHIIRWDMDGKGNGARATALAYFRLSDGMIEWELSNFLKQKIMLEGYTPLNVDIIMSFESKYAITLYENLCIWKQRKWIEFTLEHFRELMGIEPQQYSKMCNFKEYVLDVAIKEINEKTDLKLFCIDQKKGAKITGFRFEWQILSKKDINDRDKQKILTEKYLSAYKEHLGTKFFIHDKWYTLTTDGLINRGKSFMGSFIDDIEFLKKMKQQGIEIPKKK